MSKIIYVIAGCNGAGKTTASFTILPEILNCKIFVNADEIAKGLSPFQPEAVAFEAGRIMIERINSLIKDEKTFSIETTLSTKSYKKTFQRAIDLGYEIKLVYFWLNSSDLAIKRVERRVKEGGHDIPKEIIIRRFRRGLENLFKIYLPLLSEVMLFDNSDNKIELIAKGKYGFQTILNIKKWETIKLK